MKSVACTNRRRRNKDGNAAWVKYGYPNYNRYTFELTTWETNKKRCDGLGLRVCPYFAKQGWDGSAYGYSDWWRPEHIWLNTPCRVMVQIDEAGSVTIIHSDQTQAHYKQNAFDSSGNSIQVQWDGTTSVNGGNFPRASAQCAANCTIPSVAGGPGNTCLCELEVKESVLFGESGSNKPGFMATGRIPTRTEIEKECKIGSADPTMMPEQVALCTTSACNAAATLTQNEDVKVYLATSSSRFDADTVFRIKSFGGKGPPSFLRNVGSKVHVGAFSFRNPPQFMASWRPKDQPSYKAAAEEEVEALLDHLFYHQNNAVHVGYRLIQRMVTSNPSPRYIQAVSTAFTTGTYGGKTYSGKYGDLAATVAAVLLDKEATSDVLDLDPYYGRLREPLLKVIHLLRSMEYKAKDGREVELDSLSSRIGQQVYKSPTVFNFYLPEYQPDGRIMAADLVSPESQLSTPPYTLGFLNGMVSLIKWGLTECLTHLKYNGFGTCRGTCPEVRPHRCGLHNRRRRIPWDLYSKYYAADVEPAVQGALTWQPENNTTTVHVVDEISLLLTNGRLSPAVSEKIIKAYDEAEAKNQRPGEGLRMAQMLTVASAEYHSTAENILTAEVRPAPTTVPSQGRPYKAIVVIFFHGGIDSFNLLVPHSECTANQGKDMYQEYADVRSNVALPKADLLPIDATTGKQPCGKFGLHPLLGEVQKQYQAGETAWLANIGQLIQPITKQQMRDGSIRRPPSQYAHNFARKNAQSVHAQMKTAQGVAGRMMKSLESLKTKPYNGGLYSVNGNQKILQGGKNMADVISGSGVTQYEGGIGTSGFGLPEESIKEMLTQNRSTSLFSNTYVDLLEGGLLRTKLLGKELAKSSNNPKTSFASCGSHWNTLGMQLNQVAKIMKANGELKNERAVFFTQTGGFDTHKDLGTTLERELPGIDCAIKLFKEEMKDQGLWDNVALVTMSDFARTLTSNGRGTDHAWGGNMFLTGGTVNGGKIHGEFPDDLTSKGPLNVGRGRLIPTRGWESMWHGIAEWMGVPQADMDAVIPNKKLYQAGQLFKGTDLFKG